MKSKESKRKMTFLTRTRNLFQQLVTDHQEGNGESTAAEDHKQGQQLMPVLRAEWQILKRYKDTVGRYLYAIYIEYTYFTLERYVMLRYELSLTYPGTPS